MDSSLSIQNDASDSNGGIFNITRQENGQKQQMSLVACPLSTITKAIPPELFIGVFKTIPPEDLFSVAQVCKLFNDILSSNQQIWRSSRLAYWPHLPLPPPVGMDEQSYIKLAMLEKGCQFCHKRKIGLRVYWAFQVRCCKECLLDVTISDSGLWNEVATNDSYGGSGEIQPNIYSLLPYVNIGGPLEETRYWTADVKAALLSYETPEEYLAHVTDALKIEKFRIFMEDAETRTATDNEAYLLITKSRRSRIESIIDDFSNRLNEEGIQTYSTGVLTKCPTYTKEINLFDQPFTHKDELLFKERLTSEHEILTVEIATKERRSDILHALWDLVPQPEGCTIDCENPKHFWKKRKENENPPPYLIPTTDAIFDAIEWCPSFNNPPFKDHDPRNSWEKEFLYYYLIPKIRTEADEVRKKMCIFPYWTVKGAARHRILSQARVFRCRLCYDHTRRFDYRNVDVHLQSCIHSLKTLDTDEIAEVDVMRALREICNVK